MGSHSVILAFVDPFIRWDNSDAQPQRPIPNNMCRQFHLVLGQGRDGAIPFFVVLVSCLFSSGFWSSGLFSGAECLATNDHVQSAATGSATRPLEPNAARLQHIVRAVAERRPPPFVAAVILPHGRWAGQAFFPDSGNAMAGPR
jgi:hypothetical protein